VQFNNPVSRLCSILERRSYTPPLSWNEQLVALRYYVQLRYDTCSYLVKCPQPNDCTTGEIFPNPFLCGGFPESNLQAWDSTEEHNIALKFRMGPPITLKVVPLLGMDSVSLIHNHVTYPLPPSASAHRETLTQYALPAALSDLSDLSCKLDSHFSLLVQQHFDKFPWPRSEVCLLDGVYRFYTQLSQVGNPHCEL